MRNEIQNENRTGEEMMTRKLRELMLQEVCTEVVGWALKAIPENPPFESIECQVKTILEGLSGYLEAQGELLKAEAKQRDENAQLIDLYETLMTGIKNPRAEFELNEATGLWEGKEAEYWWDSVPEDETESKNLDVISL